MNERFELKINPQNLIRVEIAPVLGVKTENKKGVEIQKEKELEASEIKEPEDKEEVARKRHEEITGLEESAQKDIAALETTREELGLPPSQEKPISALRANERIEKLEAAKETPGEKNNEGKQKTPERGGENDAVKEVIKKARFDDLSHSMRRFDVVMRERNDRRLNPIITESGLSRIKGSLGSLENALSNPKPNLNEINGAIAQITGAVDEIERVPRQAAIKEDPESLRKTVFSIQAMEDESKRMLAGLVGNETEGIGDTRKLIGSLTSILQEKRLRVARKLDYFR